MNLAVLQFQDCQCLLLDRVILVFLKVPVGLCFRQVLEPTLQELQMLLEDPVSRVVQANHFVLVIPEPLHLLGFPSYQTVQELLSILDFLEDQHLLVFQMGLAAPEIPVAPGLLLDLVYLRIRVFQDPLLGQATLQVLIDQEYQYHLMDLVVQENRESQLAQLVQHLL